ncbi:MAG: bifunctional UDP-N-acetylmuramoyl-tripeptide:D-alanyl-D-alanine ligase/alanine racemase [Cyclobacteriaceae bacterium]
MLLLSDIYSILRNPTTKDSFEEKIAIKKLQIDSRKSGNPNHTLFIAIEGERHNGHDYIAHLYEKGYRYFLVNESVVLPFLQDAFFVQVVNTLSAFQELVSHHRDKFKIPVVGITGSNAKTIVKEWLSSILKKDKQVINSPKSYNSQVGVPLSVWEMNTADQAGVFEAGISTVGEMEKLEKIILPTHGIFTTIGSAHDSGFESMKQKLSEKLKLFKHTGWFVYCKDHALIEQAVKENQLASISWSSTTKADYEISYSTVDHTTVISCYYQSKTSSFSVSLFDKASLENITHCIVFSLAFGVAEETIQKGLSEITAISMRMELLEGKNNCHLINDAYNNDIVGLDMALDVAEQQFKDKKNTLILSDLLETGQELHKTNKKLIQLIDQHKVDRFIGIGEQLIRSKPITGDYFLTTKDFLKSSITFQNELILVKGARSFGFEDIVDSLVQKKHETTLTVNLSSVRNNLNYYRSKLDHATKVMVMIKAYGYGSGNHEIAQLLQYEKVDYLGVAYVDEGIDLRQSGIETPILVLNVSPHEFENLLEFELEPEIYSLNQLSQLIQFVKQKQVTMKIHLKMDTGMHRLGFIEDELEELTTLLQTTQQLSIKSIFSHLVAAEEKNEDDFTAQQLIRFEKMAKTIENGLGYSCWKHIANSSAISRFPNAHFDMVRLGIGLYGISPIPIDNNYLQPIGTLQTTISQIKTLKKGDTIGYGRTGKIVTDNQQIATIPIGYADGFDRRLGNGIGHVSIHGLLAPTIGTVCMDMVMVDVTGINAKEGDSVEIFGDTISVESLADTMNTIPYEVLTSISERVKRVFVSEE